MNTDNSVSAEIKSIADVMNLNLQIPNYQRPYCWEMENVRQMLTDIQYSKESGRQKYRIGSVILHQDGDTYNIVDGQQRLTTLSLLRKACGYTCEGKLKFNHEDSYRHIQENYLFLQTWLDENCRTTKKDFWEYIAKSCDFVQIVVTDLSEAFQMFDSQNGRGKELEAYNLLKAYHIRAMELESQEEKIRCDKQWEAATLYDATPTIIGDANGNIDLLKQLFDEQLYRSRMWSRQFSANAFSKREISEFKGFTIDKNHLAKFPYQNPQLLQYLTAKFYKNVLEGTVSIQTRFLSGDDGNINPFVNVNQKIVNGKSFFEYIETYAEIYKRMFVDLGSFQLAEFKGFFYKYCLNYGAKEDGRLEPYAFHAKGYQPNRDGDTYLRELYKSLVFVLFDKFGENGLNKYYKILYRLVYLNRLANKKVKYALVADLPHDYFSIIANAKDLADLSRLYQIFEKIKKEKELDNYSNIHDCVIEFVKEGK